MVAYALAGNGVTTKIAWGVTLGAEDDLFSFYMTPDKCADNPTATPTCLIVNSAQFEIKTQTLDIPNNNRVTFKLQHDTGDDIISLIKIYPGSFYHDFPELR